MDPLTEAQLRKCFVNASRREAAQATLPDLEELPWDGLDYLGWRDRKAPLSAYVVFELDRGLTGVLLRASDPSTRSRRKSMCAWCEDLVHTDDITLYVARRAGAAGRAGNSVGTLICSDFICSQNVRRAPTRAELAGATQEAIDELIGRRVAGLRARSVRFVEEVLRTP